MTGSIQCPNCGAKKIVKIPAVLQAGAQGTAQCVQCGAVFTYPLPPEKRTDPPRDRPS